MSTKLSTKNSNKLITTLSIGVMAVLTIVVLTDKNLSIVSRAGKGPSTTDFGKVVLSKEHGCRNQENKYSFVKKGSNDCTPVVVSEALIKERINRDVKLDGVLKDDVFYVVDVKAVLGATSTSKPTMTPEKYKKTIPNPRMTPVTQAQ